jgi:hypothetical protein
MLLSLGYKMLKTAGLYLVPIKSYSKNNHLPYILESIIVVFVWIMSLFYFFFSDEYFRTSLRIVEKTQRISSKSQFFSICTTFNRWIRASHSTNINKNIHHSLLHSTSDSSLVYLTDRRYKDRQCRSSFFRTICTLEFNIFTNSHMSMLENLDQLRQVSSYRIHATSSMQ